MSARRWMFGVVVVAMGLQAGLAQAQDAFDSAMARGQAARVANDFAAAEAAFRDAARLSPQDAQARHMLGLMLGFQARYEDALNTLDEALRLAPQDTDIALSVARVSAWASRFDAAERKVDDVLALAPTRQDAWTLKGRIAFYQAQYDRARAAFDRALALGPADVDLLLGLGDVARAQGREADAMNSYRGAERLDPTSPEVRDRLQNRAQPDVRPWRLSLGGGKSWLSRTPAPDWATAQATLERLIAANTRAFAGVEYARRFGFDDVAMRAGVSTRMQAWDMSLSAAVTPQDNVLPEFQLDASLGAMVSGTAGTRASVDAQWRRYAIGSIRTLAPGLEQTFAEGRFSVAARWVNTFDATDDHLSGWSARAYLQATDRVGLQAGYGVAPEAERGIVRDTKSLTGALIIDVNETLRWRVDAAREIRQGGYRRLEFTSGFLVAF